MAPVKPSGAGDDGESSSILPVAGHVRVDALIRSQSGHGAGNLESPADAAQEGAVAAPSPDGGWRVPFAFDTSRLSLPLLPSVDRIDSGNVALDLTLAAGAGVYNIAAGLIDLFASGTLDLLGLPEKVLRATGASEHDIYMLNMLGMNLFNEVHMLQALGVALRAGALRMPASSAAKMEAALGSERFAPLEAVTPAQKRMQEVRNAGAIGEAKAEILTGLVKREHVFASATETTRSGLRKTDFFDDGLKIIGQVKEKRSGVAFKGNEVAQILDTVVEAERLSLAEQVEWMPVLFVSEGVALPAEIELLVAAGRLSVFRL